MDGTCGRSSRSGDKASQFQTLWGATTGTCTWGLIRYQVIARGILNAKWNEVIKAWKNSTLRQKVAAVDGHVTQLIRILLIVPCVSEVSCSVNYKLS